MNATSRGTQVRRGRGCAVAASGLDGAVLEVMAWARGMLEGRSRGPRGVSSGGVAVPTRFSRAAAPVGTPFGDSPSGWPAGALVTRRLPVTEGLTRGPVI